MRKPSWHKVGGGGFTFLEMVVVIVIFGALMLLATPSMRALQERNKLKTAARDMVALFAYARGEAVFGSKTVETRIDFSKNRYRVVLDPSNEGADERRRRRQATGTREEVERNLPEDVSFQDIYIWSEQVAGNGEYVVEFYPNGTVTPVIVTLQDKKGKSLSLELGRSSGRCRVTEGKPENAALPGQAAVVNTEIVVKK